MLIMYGNPADGFKAIGPVTPNTDEAEMIIRWLDGETWWLIPVTSETEMLAIIAEEGR